PSGRQFFSGQTSLLAPHRSTSGYARRSRLVWPKNPLPRNVIIFMFMTTKLTAVDPNFNGRKWYCPPTFRESVDVAVSAANLQVAAAQATDPQVLLGLALLAPTEGSIRRNLSELAVKARPDYDPILAVGGNTMDG